MGEAERRVRQAAKDAVDEPQGYEGMRWDGDMLVPLESPLDAETLDEQTARGMGPNWEPRRE